MVRALSPQNDIPFVRLHPTALTSERDGDHGQQQAKDGDDQPGMPWIGHCKTRPAVANDEQQANLRNIGHAQGMQWVVH